MNNKLYSGIKINNNVKIVLKILFQVLINKNVFVTLDII